MNETIRRIGSAYLLLGTWVIIAVTVALAVMGLIHEVEPVGPEPMSQVQSFGAFMLGMLAATIVTAALWLRLRAGRRADDDRRGIATASNKAAHPADASSDAPLVTIR